MTGWVAGSGVAGCAVLLALATWHARTVQMDAVARACHEVRGPLTAVRLGLELGARTGELPNSQLRAIELELGRAALALDDLALAHRRPRGGSPCRIDPVDVAALLADSVEAWRVPAAAHGVPLALTWAGPGAQVWGDRLRLAQATGNLIANAIEHGGGAVEVRGSVGRGILRVEVVDDGPGLPAPVAELTRRARRRRDRGGRGLGLAITAAIAEAHGGRLGAAPSERGARLVLELPLAARVAPAGR